MKALKGEKKDDSDMTEIRRKRTNMAIVHFLLTAPKWSISLFLFLAACRVPLSSRNEAIDEPLQRLHTLVQLESHSYKQCVEESFDKLQLELKEVAREEYDRIQLLHDSNNDMIQNSQNLANTCANAAGKVHDALFRWRKDGMQISWVNNTSICNENDKQRLIDLLGGESLKVEEEVSLALDEYIQSSENSLSLVHQYAVDRFNYDFEYFVTDRIHPAMEFLEGNSFIMPFHPSFDEEEVRRQIWESLSQVKNTMESMRAEVAHLDWKMREFFASVNAFYSAYDDLYNRFLLGATFIRDVIPPGISVPEYFEVSSIPLGVSLLPSTMYLPFIEEFESTQDLLENATSHCLDVLNSLIHNLGAQANQHLRGASDHVTDRLSTLLHFHDYNPPKFVGSREGIADPMQELDSHSQLSRAIQNSTKAALAQLHGTGSFDGRDFMESNNMDFDEYYISEDGTIFGYLQPRLPRMTIPELIERLISFLFANTWIVEVFLQGFRLWRLEATYARGAIPDLPEVDYSDDDKDPEQASASGLLMIKLFRSFASPRVVILLIFSPMFVLAVSFWYPHVKTSCDAPYEGTFLANNVFAPLAINEANALGNAHYIKGEFRCYQTRRRVCDQMQAESAVLSRTDMAAFQAVLYQHNHSMEAIEIVQNCVDEETQKQINDSCCGLKGFSSECTTLPSDFICPIDKSSEREAAFRPLVEYLSEPSCDKENFHWNLPEDRYNCLPMVETCEKIACDGVNEDLIRSQVIQTDCKIELYALSCFLFLFWFIYHAIVVNLICTLAFKGIRQISWRKLSPYGIRLRTRLLEDGNLAKGRDKTDREERISTAIKRFELLGWFQCALGGLTFSIWLFTLFPRTA